MQTRQVSVALLFPLLELRAHRLVGDGFRTAIDALTTVLIFSKSGMSSGLDGAADIARRPISPVPSTLCGPVPRCRAEAFGQ